eukprot:jgi/Chrpa1/1112/Chrysochromulina_OHIO_Genome00011020-RA
MREAISGRQRPSSGTGRRDEHLVGRKDEGRPAGGRNELCHRKGLPRARSPFEDKTPWTHLGRREGRSKALDHSPLLSSRWPDRAEIKRPMGAKVVSPNEALYRLSLRLSRRLDDTRVDLFEGRERLRR